MSRPRILPILAVFLAAVALVLSVVSYPALAPLVLVGGAIVLAILTPKE